MLHIPAEIIALKNQFDSNPTRESVFALLDVVREALDGPPGLLP